MSFIVEHAFLLLDRRQYPCPFLKTTLAWVFVHYDIAFMRYTINKEYNWLEGLFLWGGLLQVCGACQSSQLDIGKRLANR
jgi:hypothetical protein